jgi:hypothetical protein
MSGSDYNLMSDHREASPMRWVAPADHCSTAFMSTGAMNESHVPCEYMIWAIWQRLGQEGFQ